MVTTNNSLEQPTDSAFDDADLAPRLRDRLSGEPPLAEPETKKPKILTAKQEEDLRNKAGMTDRIIEELPDELKRQIAFDAEFDGSSIDDPEVNLNAASGMGQLKDGMTLTQQERDERAARHEDKDDATLTVEHPTEPKEAKQEKATSRLPWRIRKILADGPESAKPKSGTSHQDALASETHDPNAYLRTHNNN
jgi:hypothetical protein